MSLPATRTSTSLRTARCTTTAAVVVVQEIEIRGARGAGLGGRGERVQRNGGTGNREGESPRSLRTQPRDFCGDTGLPASPGNTQWARASCRTRSRAGIVKEGRLPRPGPGFRHSTMLRRGRRGPSPCAWSSRRRAGFPHGLDDLVEGAVMETGGCGEWVSRLYRETARLHLGVVKRTVCP